MDGVNRETFIDNIGFRYQKCGSTAPAVGVTSCTERRYSGERQKLRELGAYSL